MAGETQGTGAIKITERYQARIAYDDPAVFNITWLLVTEICWYQLENAAFASEILDSISVICRVHAQILSHCSEILESATDFRRLRSEIWDSIMEDARVYAQFLSHCFEILESAADFGRVLSEI
ncbi:hypothetical protein CAC42_4414 [Sphaceloma murrayae]|uniref:Uncharacterized protein n=1 Tax=Sphaceloma murrayae TaxID=2082308 RepID=A0A2K1QMG0_9PEZI|nr:hypothetical protein CAC42_4414 [Sphaceloma murrayae]